MVERPRGGQTSPRFDRVSRPDPSFSGARRTHTGTQALYSTAPGAPKSAQVLIRCRRCTVETGLGLRGVLRLLRPPMLADPVRGLLWARCPACQRRSCLEVSQGQALRALLGRPPGR